MFCKVTNFHVWVSEDFLSKGQKGYWLQTLLLPLSVSRQVVYSSTKMGKTYLT